MKKLLAIVLVCLLLAAAAPAAFAESSAIRAVYALPVPELLPEAEFSGDPADSLVFFYEDGSFRHYVLHDGKNGLLSEGSYVTDGGAAFTKASVLSLSFSMPRPEGPASAGAGIRRELKLSELEKYRLYPADGDRGVSVAAVFMQPAMQKLVRKDGTEVMLSTLWIYFDNGTFRQYAQIPGTGEVLFSSGDYSVTDGFVSSGADADSVLTLHRTQKYADGTGLTAYDSTHDYVISELGFFRVYPPAAEVKVAPAAIPDIREDAAETVVLFDAVPESEMLTQTQALEIAAQHANLRVEQLMLTSMKMDYEHGRQVYELEFVSGGMEYEYDVDCSTGEILAFSQDYAD